MNTSLSPDERAALLLAQMTLEEKVDMLHEENRLEVDAQLNERTLREIYTLPFAAAVQDGHVGAVMGAFNKINGIYCCEHPHLLSRMLSSGQGYRPC